jgi:hypothetical protein
MVYSGPGYVPPTGAEGAWNCPGGDEACNFGGSVDNYSDDGCESDLATYSNAGSEYTLLCNLNADGEGNPDGNLLLQFTLVTAYGVGEAYAFNVGSGSVVVTQADIDAQGFSIALSGGDLYSGGTLTISW